MKRIYIITAITGVACGAAWAQGDVVIAAKLRAENVARGVAGVKFGMMGPAVKGAPYSADGVTETAQTLGDGTHINRQETYTIYRDGEGRIRRESGDQIWISDPVANTSYVIDTKQQTARKMNLGRDAATFKMVLDAKTAKLNAEGSAKMVYWTGGALSDHSEAKPEPVVSADYAPRTFRIVADHPEAKPEPLGKQEMEGVEVEGTRTTIAIPQGQIGNDRALQIVSERWESAELHVTVLSKHTDPMMGDTTERLTNIRRGEPDPALFQVPAGYTLAAIESDGK